MYYVKKKKDGWIQLKVKIRHFYYINLLSVMQQGRDNSCLQQ